MTRDDMLRMAREAGFAVGRDEWVFQTMLHTFASLVASAEREACAKACEEDERGFGIEGHWCAVAIRERGAA